MKIPFVAYSGLEQPKEYVQQCMHAHALGILAAPAGSGLTRLLEHSVQTSAVKVAHIRLFEPHKAQVRTSKLASSATVIAFSLLWSQLNRLSRPHSDRQKIPQYATYIAPLTDRDFLKAYDGLLQLLDHPRSAVEAIIIDNAQHGDAKFFNILLQLLDECHIPPALILGVRLEGHAKANEALSRQRAVVPALEHRRRPTSTLSRMTDKMFDAEILPALLLQSKIYLDEQVAHEQDQVLTQLWDRTNGNWHRLHLLYTALQMYTVPTQQQTLELTWDAYQKVLHELDGGT